MTIKKSLLLSYLLIFLVDVSYARWGSIKDSPIEVIAYNRTIHVNKEGTAKETIEARIKLLNQIGREHYSSYRMNYNYDNSKIRIIEAKAIVNGKEYLVENKNIEDKSLASTPEGFDDIHQILIVFPNADVGSELSLKYEKELTHPPLENFYETSFIYGSEGISSNSKVQLTSEIPFFIHINDPKKVLDVKQFTHNDLYHLEIQQIKPVYTQIFNEANSNINPKYFTIVHLSTIKTWQEFAKRLKPPYFKVLDQKLPKSYLEISKKASKAKNLIDQINIVTSMLAEKIRYMGDWRSTSGRFIPRELNIVDSTQYGDCKDLATATTVILRTLGIEADLALVTRGSWIYNYPSHLAGFSKFNHVIVRVKSDNKYLWIDPTNIGSMAGEVFFDISNRKSLILTSEIPSMDYIPKTQPKNHIVEVKENIDLAEQDNYKIYGKLFYFKTAAYPLTASSLFASIDNIEHYILNQIGDPTRISNKKVSIPDLKSRIVTDLVFDYSFNERSYEIITNAGQGIMLNSHGLSGYLADPTRVSDLFLGQPNILKIDRKYTNVKASKYDFKGVQINSPWIDVIREVNYDDTFINVKDTITIKKSLISSEELQSKEYLTMHKTLEQYFTNGSAIIFKRIANKPSA